MKLVFDPDQKIDLKLQDGSRLDFKLRRILAPPGETISLKKDFDPDFTGGFKGKEEAKAYVEANQDKLAELQDRLYAQGNIAVLLIFQAMDAAGKDGAIKHVMSGVNPQGCIDHELQGPLDGGAEP
jgi:polyphosphate kinase 2 (PPK2 family)